MLRLTLALVAIALTALPAVAADKLPAEMLGTWCLDEHEASTFRRGDCQDKTDSWLQVNADGYQGHEFGCKAIKVSVDRRNPRYTVYELESRCEGEAKTWTATINMWLGVNDTLVIVEAPRGRRDLPPLMQNCPSKTKPTKRTALCITGKNCRRWQRWGQTRSLP